MGDLGTDFVGGFLGVEQPFFCLLHALRRPGRSPDRDHRVGAAAADSTQLSDSVTHPSAPPLPQLQSEATRLRKNISDESPSWPELEIELSR